MKVISMYERSVFLNADHESPKQMLISIQSSVQIKTRGSNQLFYTNSFFNNITDSSVEHELTFISYALSTHLTVFLIPNTDFRLKNMIAVQS